MGWQVITMMLLGMSVCIAAGVNAKDSSRAVHGGTAGASAAGTPPAPPWTAYTLAPIKLTKAEASTREAVVDDAAFIEAAPSNGRVVLQLEKFDPAVIDVSVDGLGEPVTVSSRAVVFIASPADGTQLRRSLRYRVRYAEGVLPGFRPAPLRIAVIDDVYGADAR